MGAPSAALVSNSGHNSGSSQVDAAAPGRERNFHARDLNPRPTDRALITRSQLSPFVNDETAASRRGLAFERAHFSPDPLNGGSPDADGRSRLVDACAAP